MNKNGMVPLERALSKLGLASRTQARVLILGRKVEIDGRIILDPLYLVRPESVQIKIRGKDAEPPVKKALLYYKPRGVVTTRSDEKGRMTIYTNLPGEYQGLHAAGRLDMATSGLLVLTNSTKFSSWLTDPANEIPRVYAVTVRGKMEEETVEAMRDGIMDSGELLKADEVILRKSSNRESHLIITLCEGKNREIRRLCKLSGHEVARLKRISFGNLELGALQPGEFRELPEDEIKKIFPSAPF